MENTEEKSKVGNRIFYIVLTLLILGSIGMAFYKIIIVKNFQIETETSCDPKIESCFHREAITCDSTDPNCEPVDASDYKLISKKASDIYACEQTEEKLGCREELSCTENELNCSYIFCTVDNLPEGEFCSTFTP
jgi:hypothetical protein